MPDDCRVFRLLAAAVTALALTVLGVSAALAAELSVSMPSVIEVRPGGFYFGEYAEIDGDEELEASVSMAYIEPTGSTLRKSEIIDALGSTRAAGRSIALRVPDEVRLVPESSVAAELRAMTGWRWRIETDCPKVDTAESFKLPPRVSPGAKSIMAKIPNARGEWGNRQIKLKWYQPIVYTTVACKRGDIMDVSRLRTKIGTVQMNDGFASDAASLRGTSPRRAMQSGTPIQMSYMNKTAVVRSGAQVSLVSVENGLGVEVLGIAMQRGCVGDVIKVRNANSKKILLGTVIDDGRVMIE